MGKELSKLDKLRLLIGECNKSLGAEGKVFLGEELTPIERIETGILPFDVLLGGGLPRCHLVELYGEESAGKTLLALQAIAACQRKKLTCAWVQGEEFPEWAEKQGVNFKSLVTVSTLTGDTALETAATLIESGVIDVMVFDSYQALGTTRELDAGVESESYAGGGAPQLWGRFYRRTRAAYNSGKSTTALIGISQVRDPIGAFSPNGKPEPRPTQIRTLKHWKAVSIQCKKGDPLFSDQNSDRKKMVAREFLLHCRKNKTSAKEGQVASYTYHFKEHDGYEVGLDKIDAVFRAAKVYGLVESKGAVLEGYGIKVRGSKEDSAVDQFKRALADKPTVVKELYTDVLSMAVER